MIVRDYPFPEWCPVQSSPDSWIIENLRKYLRGKRFSLFRYGTCVIWPSAGALNAQECVDTLVSVVKFFPDFKVLRHAHGDYLVTFRGGVGAVVSGSLLQEKFPEIKHDALKYGLLPNEKFFSEGAHEIDEIEMVAGIYARARLYMDAHCPDIVFSSPLL